MQVLVETATTRHPNALLQITKHMLDKTCSEPLDVQNTKSSLRLSSRGTRTLLTRTTRRSPGRFPSQLCGAGQAGKSGWPHVCKGNTGARSSDCCRTMQSCTKQLLKLTPHPFTPITDPPNSVGMAISERRKELCRFAVSEETMQAAGFQPEQ